jgi:hypothetical protein
MLQIRNILLFIILFMAFSCIKPYDPDIDKDVSTKYVVNGRVTDMEGWQEVRVSLSSPAESPEYIPVQGCQVAIQDDKGNVFELEEYQTGAYQVWIDEDYLTAGTGYKVEVQTPDGELLQSTFDTMAVCPPLDSVYYIFKEIPTTDPTVYIRSMQYYVDLVAEGYESYYFKWEVEETWEYHSRHALEYYYDGDWHPVYPPDSSNWKCWESGLVPEVFTLATASFTSNNYPQVPLHIIDGRSSRLSVLYSILVRQLAISEKTYNYWEQLRENSAKEGGLYEKQPLAIEGNIQNASDPGKTVLGYFYAASESTRRYFYSDIPEIEFTFNDLCQEDPLGRMGWREYWPRDYPVYYYFNELNLLRILANECIECQLRGGTTDKPDFWP